MNKTELDPNTENAILIQGLGFTDGNLESPINLDISFMKVINLTPLEWVNIDVTPRKLKITNTGHTVILSATWDTERPYLTGGPLKGSYVFSQLHFHWGENEMNGSEHSIDGASMPMELHVVFFKSDYEKFDLALRRIDGIIVVVYFFKLRNEPNQFIHDILKHLSVIQVANSSVRIMPSKLTNIVRPFNQDYFLYWGSMRVQTSESKILWIINREPIGVSVEQEILGTYFEEVSLLNEVLK
ncbi:carbonic anhydrase 13 [Nomia melanderi]|uniref:carbonic anhydrase 13 n=1 Tax=Nomia melanderi TaxID=2448451 RepID=UPI003FCDC9A5